MVVKAALEWVWLFPVFRSLSQDRRRRRRGYSYSTSTILTLFFLVHYSFIHFLPSSLLIVLSKFSRCCVVRSFRTLTRSDPLSSSEEISPLSSPFFAFHFLDHRFIFYRIKRKNYGILLSICSFFSLSLSLSSLSSLKCHQEKSHYRVYLHPTPPFILVNLGERKHLPLAFTFLREDSSLSKRILWTITMWFTLDPLFHDFHLFVFPSFHFLYFPSYFPFSYFSFPFFPITPLFPPSFVTISFCTSLVSRREISHSHPFSKKDLTPTWTLHFHSNFCIGVSWENCQKTFFPFPPFLFMSVPEGKWEDRITICGSIIE